MRTGVERDARGRGVVVSPLQFTTRPGTTSAPSSIPLTCKGRTRQL